MFGFWPAECVVVPGVPSCMRARWPRSSTTPVCPQVFASPKIGPALASVTNRPIETIGSEAHRRAGLGSAPASPPCTEPSTLAWLFYTSGTTGRSKGAMLSAPQSDGDGRRAPRRHRRPDQGCSLVHAAPMSHGSGLYLVPYVLRVPPESGGFDPDEFLDLLRTPPGLHTRVSGADARAAPGADGTTPPGGLATPPAAGRCNSQTLKARWRRSVRIFAQTSAAGRVADDLHWVAPRRPRIRR